MIRIKQSRKKVIAQAIRQVERWIFAAEQDKNTGIALLHANYAVGNIDMLRQMYTDKEIEHYTGKEPLDLLLRATLLQDKAQSKLVIKCPGAMVHR